jgi:hypothetical protein
MKISKRVAIISGVVLTVVIGAGVGLAKNVDKLKERLTPHTEEVGQESDVPAIESATPASAATPAAEPSPTAVDNGTKKLAS